MPNPRSPYEWLYNRIAYCENIEDLRSHAMSLLIMVGDSDPIQDVYEQEMKDDGFFEDYEDEPYDDGSDWVDDKETYDFALELHVRDTKRKLGR